MVFPKKFYYLRNLGQHVNGSRDVPISENVCKETKDDGASNKTENNIRLRSFMIDYTSKPLTPVGSDMLNSTIQDRSFQHDYFFHNISCHLEQSNLLGTSFEPQVCCHVNNHIRFPSRYHECEDPPPNASGLTKRDFVVDDDDGVDDAVEVSDEEFQDELAPSINDETSNFGSGFNQDGCDVTPSQSTSSTLEVVISSSVPATEISSLSSSRASEVLSPSLLEETTSHEEEKGSGLTLTICRSRLHPKVTNFDKTLDSNFDNRQSLTQSDLFNQISQSLQPSSTSSTTHQLTGELAPKNQNLDHVIRFSI